MSKGSSDPAVLRTGGLKHLVPEYFPEMRSRPITR
jgi:hypothetical protein